ncbi:MAG: hypothetical protein ABIM21_02425 [candidate division WOR-3 bacterium]
MANLFVVKSMPRCSSRGPEPIQWTPESLPSLGISSPLFFCSKEENVYLLEEVLKAIEDYTKRRTEILNRLEALHYHLFPNRKVEKVYEKEFHRVEETIRVLEREAES